MDLGIKGRRAIVCASSKGLGRACAMSLAAEGVHVTLTARGAEVLAKTAAEIRKASPGVTVTEVVGDITTPAGREAALKACPDPDILINNAGIAVEKLAVDQTEADWDAVINANLKGAYFAATEMARRMIARRPLIPRSTVSLPFVQMIFCSPIRPV